jgi:hypothetical protein
MCSIPNSSKIVDEKEILRTVSNTGSYCSSDKVGTVYVVQYIFEKSTVNINALCNSCEDMVQCTMKPFGIGHMYTHTFLLRVTDTMTSQNIDLSS